MSSGEKTAPRLIFAWPERHHVSFKLAGFLLLSLLLHASAFYLFQIAKPTSATILPPPARVELLTPSSPENRALLRWIASEDPARVVAPPAVLPEHLTQVVYQPYFARLHTKLQIPKAATNPAPAVPYPAPASLTMMVSSALPAQKIARKMLPASKTELHFSGLLGTRGLEKKTSPPQFAKNSATLLDDATFMIGVSERGDVRYLFLEKTSGDKMMDAQAATYLKSLDFKNSGMPITWGFATFRWGGDAYANDEGKGK